MSAINLHNLLNSIIFCCLRTMEVFVISEAILPNVHSRERLKSSYRLLVHDHAVAGLAQPASGQTQLSQPMSHLLRAKFGSLAPRFR